MIFKKIRWKNFLSYGNNWTEMDLNQNKIIGISGTNGTGKSILIDAIYFALTGQTYRKKIKKSQITNTRNKKNCCVELYVKRGKDNYIIKRGIKPDIFEIVKNDKNLEEDAHIKDFQSILEQIFKFKPKVLKNTLIMSSMDYKPFLQFTAGDKREYIEDILSLHIFANMLDNLKIDLSILKKDNQELDVEYQLIEREINTIIEMNNKIIEQQKSDKTDIKNKISVLSDKIKDSKDRLLKYKNKFEEFNETYKKQVIKKDKGLKKYQSEKTNIETEIRKYNQTILREKDDIKKEKTIITFFDDNSICNTCKQDINIDHKKQIIDDVNERIQNINDKILALNDKISIEENKLIKINEVKEKILKFDKKINNFYLEKIEPINKEIDNLNNEIRLSKNNLQNFENTLQKLDNNSTIKKTENKEKKKEEIGKKIFILNEKKKVLELSKVLLSDKGIKLYIIEKYIPLLNKYVNQFLDLVCAPYRLKFDNQLQETIVLRGYENLSYHSFSSGEKQRCDLSLLFSFVNIAKIKNSFDCNLLMLDEIMDASMDEEGIRGIINILQDYKSKGKTIFIISHKNKIKNMFDKNYETEKKIFSTMKEA